jgi:hypothetical protein
LLLCSIKLTWHHTTFFQLCPPSRAWSVTRNLFSRHSDCIIRTQPVGRLHGPLRIAIGRIQAQPKYGLSLTRFPPLRCCIHACMEACPAKRKATADHPLPPSTDFCFFGPSPARAREGLGETANDAQPVCSVAVFIWQPACQRGLAIGNGHVTVS